MNWDTVSQIATSLGALLAAVSLIAGFLLYRLTQRDEMAAQFRQMIATSRPKLEQLRDMVSFELARELSTTAVHSRDLELPLKDLYEYCRPPSDQSPKREEVVSYLEKNFPVITVPLNTPLVHQYQGLTASVTSDVALYQASFPGVFRVVTSMALLFENVLVNEKAIARDEELWEAILPNLLEEKDRIVSLPHMKWMMTEILTAGIMEHMNRSRKQIKLLTGMIDLVFETYLNKTASELRSISRSERAEKVQPTRGTKTITEDLHEAEKCLRHAFASAQLAQYRELLDEFGSPGAKEDDDESGSREDSGSTEDGEGKPQEETRAVTA